MHTLQLRDVIAMTESSREVLGELDPAWAAKAAIHSDHNPHEHFGQLLDGGGTLSGLHWPQLFGHRRLSR